MKRILTLDFDFAAWRDALGWQQKQAAQALGIGASTLQAYESCRFKSPASMVWLAKYITTHGLISRDQGRHGLSPGALTTLLALERAPTPLPAAASGGEAAVAPRAGNGAPPIRVSRQGIVDNPPLSHAERVAITRRLGSAERARAVIGAYERGEASAVAIVQSTRQAQPVPA